MYLDREMPKDLFNKKYENWDDKIKELSEKGLKVVPTIIVKGLSR